MSKQSNQRYRKEIDKKLFKNSTASNKATDTNQKHSSNFQSSEIKSSIQNTTKK